MSTVIIEIFQEFQKEKFPERSTNSILNQRKRTNKSVIQTKLVSLPPVYPWLGSLLTVLVLNYSF